jgi:hypothetical protein
MQRAEADARAKEMLELRLQVAESEMARLQLEAAAEDRRVWRSVRTRDMLQVFKGMPFKIELAPNLPEVDRLGAQIKDILTEAGWKFEGRHLGNPATLIDGVSVLNQAIHMLMAIGVDPASTPQFLASHQLAEYLEANDIQANAGDRADTGVPEGVLLIRIGRKPPFERNFMPPNPAMERILAQRFQELRKKWFPPGSKLSNLIPMLDF